MWPNGQAPVIGNRTTAPGCCTREQAKFWGLWRGGRHFDGKSKASTSTVNSFSQGDTERRLQANLGSNPGIPTILYGPFAEWSATSTALHTRTSDGPLDCAHKIFLVRLQKGPLTRAHHRRPYKRYRFESCLDRKVMWRNGKRTRLKTRQKQQVSYSSASESF